MTTYLDEESKVIIDTFCKEFGVSRTTFLAFGAYHLCLMSMVGNDLHNQVDVDIEISKNYLKNDAGFKLSENYNKVLRRLRRLIYLHVIENMPEESKGITPHLVDSICKEIEKILDK